MKLALSQQFFEKYPNKFKKSPSCERLVVPCGQTDGRTDTKLTVVFRNFANAPKNNCIRLKMAYKS